MIAYMNYWHGTGPDVLRREGVDIVDPYALQPGDWSHWRGLLIPAIADQRHLLELRSELEDWFQTGGTLVCNGHVAYSYLSWLQPFRPRSIGGVEGLCVHRVAEHPVFAGVDTEDLTFRRGVAGFYARGSNPPPADAQVLNVLGTERLPIDWLLERPDGGRLLMHSGNNVWMYAGDGTSAARVLPQLLAWIRGEVA